MKGWKRFWAVPFSFEWKKKSNGVQSLTFFQTNICCSQVHFQIWHFLKAHFCIRHVSFFFCGRYETFLLNSYFLDGSWFDLDFRMKAILNSSIALLFSSSWMSPAPFACSSAIIFFFITRLFFLPQYYAKNVAVLVKIFLHELTLLVTI